MRASGEYTTESYKVDSCLLFEIEMPVNSTLDVSESAISSSQIIHHLLNLQAQTDLLFRELAPIGEMLSISLGTFAKDTAVDCDTPKAPAVPAPVDVVTLVQEFAAPKCCAFGVKRYLEFPVR